MSYCCISQKKPSSVNSRWKQFVTYYSICNQLINNWIQPCNWVYSYTQNHYYLFVYPWSSREIMNLTKICLIPVRFHSSNNLRSCIKKLMIYLAMSCVFAWHNFIKKYCRCHYIILVIIRSQQKKISCDEQGLRKW